MTPMIEASINLIRNINLTSAIDIAVIALFIYIVVGWLKKAKARFMFVGMLTIGILYVFARFFHLYLTTVLFQEFFSVALIMIVVIFQEDFRQFFERVATLEITRKHRNVPVDQNALMVNNALINLSRKNIGALVVIQEKDPLDRHLEAGTKIDASLSEVLLETIFDPHVPTHDGAVVIDGNRVVYSGTHLPLSTNVKEIGRLGTRHAAALGLAERSDALCVVVSEENGMISVAKDARIRELSDLSQLYAIVERSYRTRFPRKRGFKPLSFLTHNFFEKILAVLLAFGLWFAFGSSTEIVRRDFVVPIEYRNLSAKTVIEDPKPKEVTVTLSGTEKEFNLLKPKELTLSLDTSKIKSGENLITLTPDLIKNYGNLSLVNIDPKSIMLKAYTLMTVRLPIEVRTEGRAASGLIILEIKAEPAEITLVIPDTLPKEQLIVSTEPIPLKDILQTTTVTSRLIVPPEARFPADAPPEVKVTFVIEEK
ncbi:MAG: diadenylate cyclase [Candidatus Omnitrophota bacterium]